MSALDSLCSGSTIKDLKQEISKMLNAKPSDLVLRAGYPPAPLTQSDTTLLSAAEISSGENIIVEIHQLEEETKAEPQPAPAKERPIEKKSSTIIEEKPVVQKPVVQKPIKPASYSQATESRAPAYTANKKEMTPSYAEKPSGAGSRTYTSATSAVSGGSKTNAIETTKPTSYGLDRPSAHTRKKDLDELASKKYPREMPSNMKDLPSQKSSENYGTRSSTRTNAPATNPSSLKGKEDFYKLSQDAVTVLA